MSDLSCFQYAANDFRAVLVDGDPWFVAADVVSILGIGRVHDAVRGLDADERGTDTIRTPGGDQEVTIVSESGLYSLILRSRKPEAKAFKRWITREVIPSIRKSGQYGNPLAAPELVSRADLARMVLEAEEEKKVLEQAIASQEPIVKYHERFVAESDDMVTVEHFAAQFGSTGPTVRALLTEKKVAVRRQVGTHWSRDKAAMVPDFEWRPRAGVPSQEWFELRPQHNAPRLHNGQVRQTMYVRQFYANDLAEKLGLSHPTLPVDDAHPAFVKEQS